MTAQSLPPGNGPAADALPSKLIQQDLKAETTGRLGDMGCLPTPGRYLTGCGTNAGRRVSVFLGCPPANALPNIGWAEWGGYAMLLAVEGAPLCRRHMHAIEPPSPVPCSTTRVLPTSEKQSNSIGNRALSAWIMPRLGASWGTHQPTGFRSRQGILTRAGQRCGQGHRPREQGEAATSIHHRGDGCPPELQQPHPPPHGRRWFADTALPAPG